MKALAIFAVGLIATNLMAGGAHADGDVAKGERTFKKCKACHSIGEGAKNKVGPVLNGIVGRIAGSIEGFEYSDAMQEKAAEGMVWDAATLDTFLTKPKDFVPGTKMTFTGLKKDSERTNLIAYLATFP